MNPLVRESAQKFIDNLIYRRHRFVVLETLRDKAVQEAYYAQGRESPQSVNAKRRAAGLPEISTAEAGRIISWTKKSLHIEGLALDVAPVLSNGSIPWVIKDASTAALWMSLGETGESFGFAWGGRWDPLNRWGLGRDLPHFELYLPK